MPREYLKKAKLHSGSDASDTQEIVREILDNIEAGGVRAVDAAEGQFPLVVDAVGFAVTRAAASASAEPGSVILHVGLGEDTGGLGLRRMTLQELPSSAPPPILHRISVTQRRPYSKADWAPWIGSRQGRLARAARRLPTSARARPRLRRLYWTRLRERKAGTIMRTSDV